MLLVRSSAPVNTILHDALSVSSPRAQQHNDRLNGQAVAPVTEEKTDKEKTNVHDEPYRKYSSTKDLYEARVAIIEARRTAFDNLEE